MTDLFSAARRRLVWQFRLNQSVLKLESDYGDRPALWVFDTQRGPDGYVLRDHMIKLAQREKLRLFSFGPEDGFSCASTLQSLAEFSCVDQDDAIKRKIAAATAECGAILYVVGSVKGTFASKLPKSISIWEVQHGLLDSSYLPVQADRFFTRSNASFDFLANSISRNTLTMLSHDLSPPHTVSSDIHDAASIVCYSKNPGGGCTTEALTAFEKTVIDLAGRLELPFQLKLHPRDNRLKLAMRHRRISVIRHVHGKSPNVHGPRLVVSSFSTALATNTMPGDRLLNVRLSPSDPVTEAEYGWLPAVELSELNNLGGFAVVERL